MMYGTRESFRYFTCRHCGCIQIAEVPTDLGRHYRSDYYSLAEQKCDAPAYAAWKSWLLAARLNAVLGHFSPLGTLLRKVQGDPKVPARALGLGLQAGSSILDVGCGAGQFLGFLRQVGFTNLTGVDPFLDATSVHPSGVRFIRATTREVTGQYAAIFLHHVLEHIPDQEAAFEDFKRLLLPGGKLVVSIPISGSLAQARYGTDWFQWDAPRHLFVHSEKSIGLVAQRHGFRTESATHDSRPTQFLASEQYRRGVPLHAENSVTNAKGKSLFNEAEWTHCQRLSERANRMKRGDQATFIFVHAQ